MITFFFSNTCQRSALFTGCAAVLLLLAAPANAQDEAFGAYFANQAHPGFEDPDGMPSYNISQDIDTEILNAIAPAAGPMEEEGAVPVETLIEDGLPAFYSDEELEMRPDELPENTGP